MSLDIATLPVITAIPNYNMGDELKRLLPQLITQGYDDIYVLDDASTDNSRQVVETFGSKVKFVAGQQNIGSGGNRNRILQQLSTKCLIHFLDADVELASSEMPRKVRQAMMRAPHTAFVGGLVKDSSGKQSIWNYGPRFCFQSHFTALLQAMLSTPPGLKLRSAISRFLPHFLRDWPDPTQPPKIRKTFWVLEANMVIASDVFAKYAEFDDNIRDNDIMDSCIRTQQAGLATIFNPSFIVVQHNDKNVRSGIRAFSRLKTSYYIAHKNGLRQWFLPNGHFKPRHNQ